MAAADAAALMASGQLPKSRRSSSKANNQKRNMATYQIKENYYDEMGGVDQTPLDLVIQQLESVYEAEGFRAQNDENGGESTSINILTGEQEESKIAKAPSKSNIGKETGQSTIYNIEIDEVFEISQRDYEAFLEPWNKSMLKALRLMKDKEIPYF